VNDLRDLGLEFQGLLKILQGFGIFARVEPGVAPVVQHLPVVGLEFQGRGVVGRGFVRLVQPGIHPSPVVETL
jgi:hypothetical protein